MTSDNLFVIYYLCVSKTAMCRTYKCVTYVAWITRGIKTSVIIRDKFYKQMIKTKNKQQKLSKHNSYKKYINKITELLRISKQTYYQKHFEENKNNFKKRSLLLRKPDYLKTPNLENLQVQMKSLI